MNEIVLIKLISGEELIGSLVGSAPEYIELKNVVTIAYHPTGDGKMSAGFAPHMPYAEGNLILYTPAIAFRAQLKEDMLNEYKRVFGGIITPRSGLIL